VKKELIEGGSFSWSFKFLGVYLEIIKNFLKAVGVQNQGKPIYQKSVR